MPVAFVAGFDHLPKAHKPTASQSLTLDQLRRREDAPVRVFVFLGVAIALSTLLLPVSIGLVIEMMQHMPPG